jgi:hypothetical protein
VSPAKALRATPAASERDPQEIDRSSAPIGSELNQSANRSKSWRDVLPVHPAAERHTASAKLDRTTFTTSRLLEFCSEKELIAQTGTQKKDWLVYLVKELVDNALDACEEAGRTPEIAIEVGGGKIVVVDNGPGLPVKTIERILDFSVRVSSREAYVAPTRGAQGNALKTVLAMPFVLDGQEAKVEIEAHGIHHVIHFEVDHVRQEPVIRHEQEKSEVTIGTVVRVPWPNLATQFANKDEVDHDEEDEVEEEGADEAPNSPKVNPERGRAIFTNRDGLHVAEPASVAHAGLVRRAGLDQRDRSGVAQVETVRSHLAPLVRAGTSSAPDRRLRLA